MLGMAGAAEERAKAGPSLDSGGSYGSPLAPDGTARYNDGVRAKVSPAHRIAPVPNDDRREPGDLTYEFAVTYINGSDKVFDVDAYEEVEAGYGMDAVMAEAAIDGKAPRSGEEWFPESLAPGERVTVPLRFNVPAGTKFLTFETSVSEDYRDHAIWKLPLA